MSNLPQIAQLEFDASNLTEQTTNNTIHKTFLWDFETGDFVLRDGKLVEVTGLDYVKIWIGKALRTVKGSLIYNNTQYGSQHHSLIGKNFHPDYSKSEYQRMITECLLQNDAITSVDNFTFTQDGSWLTISFDVTSIYGSANETVVI